MRDTPWWVKWVKLVGVYIPTCRNPVNDVKSRKRAETFRVSHKCKMHKTLITLLYRHIMLQKIKIHSLRTVIAWEET